MPQLNDNHLRMIIVLQWHIAVSCDHVIAWDHIITISIKKIINIKYLIILILCNATIFQPLIWYIYLYYMSHIWRHICRHICDIYVIISYTINVLQCHIYEGIYVYIYVTFTNLICHFKCHIYVTYMLAYMFTFMSHLCLPLIDI